MLIRIATGLLLLLASLQTAYAQRAIVLVRHAEKADESKDALLSPAGKARAARLSEMLASLDVRAIFVSEFKRTQETAQPLAQRLGITSTVVSAGERPALRAKLSALPATDVAVVVWHSDTLPLLIKELGASQPEPIASADYGNVFIVVPQRSGPSVLLRLRF